MGNVSVENANGQAQLITEATEKPKKDYRRRRGESTQDYLKRLQDEGLQRPASAADIPQKADDLRNMADAIQNDPNYNAWNQNIDPKAYYDPTSFPGVSKNDVASGYSPGNVDSAIASSSGVPYSFGAADGNVYSGNALSGFSQSSGVKGTLGALSQQYSKLTGETDPQWGQKFAKPKKFDPSKEMKLGGAIKGNKFTLPSGPMKLPWD